MEALITHFARDHKGNIIYSNGQPQKQVAAMGFPLRFGYNHYSDPPIIHGTSIQIDDIISIDINSNSQT